MDIKDPRTQKALLAVMAMLAVGYLYFMASFVPFGYHKLTEEKKELESKYEQLSADLNKARQTVARKEQLEKEFAEVQHRYDAARRLLPEEKEVANLLRMVTLVGQQEGVHFELFKPGPQMVQGYYIENPVDVKVNGPYHAVGQFLADVANLSRIVNVSKLSLATYEKGDEDDTVQASFTASAYTLNPNPPPPVGAHDKDAGKDGKSAKGAKGAKGGAAARGLKKATGKEVPNEG
jgi:type IV pilus assembly protein PilO